MEAYMPSIFDIPRVVIGFAIKSGYVAHRSMRASFHFVPVLTLETAMKPSQWAELVLTKSESKPSTRLTSRLRDAAQLPAHASVIEQSEQGDIPPARKKLSKIEAAIALKNGKREDK
jgi:hypothetical protein